MTTEYPDFYKMEGCGNNFVVLSDPAPSRHDWAALTRHLMDRNFGVGGDGVMIVRPGSEADFDVDMYNPDGSSMGMCGNGIRCVARFVMLEGLLKRGQREIRFRVCGDREVLCRLAGSGEGRIVEVDMGEPSFDPARIPVASGSPALNYPLSVGDGVYAVTCLSMGNPHCVTFVDKVARIDLENVGPQFEHHAFFPKRVNAEFVELVDKSTLRVRVWERGAGATMACGTGACACLVAGVALGLVENGARILLPGGELSVRWEKEAGGHVFLTGPAKEIYRGTLCE